jgi:thiol-disulfide isomerase/thioredoxin
MRHAGPAAAALLAATLACGKSGTPGTAAVGGPAPAYAAPTLAGDTVTLAELRGRPVLLNIWATWCSPCREEMPDLQGWRRIRRRGCR